MKDLNTFSFLLLILLLLPLQESLTQELPYNEGTVWSIIFIRTKPGMTNEYFRNFTSNLRGEYEEGKKQGLILSYKLLLGNAANKDDWNLLLMVEYKNMAALDGIEEKWADIDTKIIGSQEQQKAGYTERSEMRETFGTKIVREIILK
jgi:hypothetical protein